MEKQLRDAIEAGNLEGVKCIVRDNNLIGRINTTTDYSGMTPLHHACRKGDIRISTYLVDNCQADVNVKDRHGYTPLHYACDKGNIEVSRHLIEECNASVHATTNVGYTPLHFACLNGDVQISTYLIDNCQADVNVKDCNGCTPFHNACKNGNLDLVSYLIETHKCNAQITTNDGSTPLHLACNKGNIEVSRHLIEECNASVHATTHVGYTPLHFACLRGHLDTVTFLVTTGHADVNCKNSSGWTPLHKACEHGRLDVVQYMVTKTNCDINAKDEDGDTPLDVVRQKGYHEVVSFLKEHLDIKSDSSEPQSETIPSGHILTKEELQVLGALLSRFSNEKLKSIQLSLKEEQEIRDISREEVEKSLRQSGLASMADGLKDDIEKGITNMKRYEAYEQALKGGLALTLRYLKFLFFGPPRSGKTSTRRRLIKEIVNLDQLGGRSVSTGVAEISDVIIKTSKPEDVTIKKLTSESVAIAGSEWKSMKSSKGGTQLGMYDEEDLAQLFYQLICKGSTNTTPATSSEPTPMQDSHKHSKSEAPDPSNPAIVSTSTNNATGETTKQDVQSDYVTEVERLVILSDTEKSEINDAFKKLTIILRSDSPDDLKRLLEDLTMINMADVGGQPAFLDMLPALTVGPALYLLFFRLDQELQEHYPVHFLSDEGADIVLETSYCIEEVLYQCLASIACFSSHSQVEAASKSTASSRALLFGTYKDKVDDEKISQIQEILEDEFKATKLYKEGLLLKPLKSKIAFTVDNMKGTEDSEMVDIRNDIQRKIKKYFPAIPIPASWLIFRVVLNLLNKPVVSLAQCEEIAKQLSMPTSVEEAIWFFHHNIGSLMHYTNIPSMEDTVICNPQIIFDSISKLIIDKFQKASSAITEGEIEQFHHRGLFTLSHIQDTTKHPQSSLLKLNQLVDVLKYHHVLAEVKQEGTQSEPKFIMPAVMKYASESELLSPSSTLEATPSPIFIYFAGGFVPFGVFCAGVAHLIAQLDSMSPGWQLCDDQVMRNKAKFIIDGAFFATLVSRPQYIMIHIEKHQKVRCKTALEVICSKVRKTVVQALETVILNMKYKPYGTLQVSIEQPFELAFACNLEESHSDHFMIVTKDDSGHHTKCLKSRVYSDLKDRHLIWFKDENGTSSSATDIQFECAHNEDEQNINSRPHSESLASSSTLNDQHSTSESDVAPGTHLTFSSSMSDEDFFKWLRSKGISDKDCKTLSYSGITPSGFPLCDVEDFDDIGLTKIGKKLFLRIFTEVKGHTCEYVEKYLQSECPICLQVLRDPYQATCCGEDFCKECIHRVKAVNEPCPTCRERDFDLFHDKGLQRKLYNIRVYCTHKSKDCEWTGELRELDEHLSDAHSGEPSQANSRHITTKLEGKVDQTMVQPPQPITGTYTPVDTKFTMDNFDKHMRDKDTWYSPHFYTHRNGYKMCLRVDANGNASGRGTHLSVFVCLMQGEFDDQLEWPFQGSVSIKLMNQEEDRDHIIQTVRSRNAGGRCERVMTKERINNGWGIGQFLPHAELQPKYLKNDCIKLYIKNIDCS